MHVHLLTLVEVMANALGLPAAVSATDASVLHIGLANIVKYVSSLFVCLFVYLFII